MGQTRLRPRDGEDSREERARRNLGGRTRKIRVEGRIAMNRVLGVVIEGVRV